MNTDQEGTRRSPRLSDTLWKLIKEEGIPMQFHQGEFLYMQNSISPGIFCVDTGIVKVFQIMDNGTENVLRLVTHRSIFGEASTFDGEESSPAAVALSDVTARLVPKDKAKELILTNGEFAFFVVSSLVHKLKAQSDQLGKVSGKKVICRLAAILCTLDYYGIPKDDDGWYSLTQAELAGIVSTTRPNITVLLKQLVNQGLIRIRRNKLSILDADGLKKLSISEE